MFKNHHKSHKNQHLRIYLTCLLLAISGEAVIKKLLRMEHIRKLKNTQQIPKLLILKVSTKSHSRCTSIVSFNYNLIYATWEINIKILIYFTPQIHVNLFIVNQSYWILSSNILLHVHPIFTLVDAKTIPNFRLH